MKSREPGSSVNGRRSFGWQNTPPGKEAYQAMWTAEPSFRAVCFNNLYCNFVLFILALRHDAKYSFIIGADAIISSFLVQ